jgi:hypothetical protein
VITPRIGRRVLRVATLAEARDRTGLGASGFPPGELTTPGRETLLATCNGRIWRGKGPDAALVFDPDRTLTRG